MVNECPQSRLKAMARAFAEGAYPGTGVYTVLLHGGRSYGARGERNLADLVRMDMELKTPR